MSTSLFEQPMTFDEAQRFVRRDAELDAAMKKVRTLDFALLQRKLMEESGWTQEMCDEAAELYRKFLALNLRYPERKICPTGPIDDFWHAHILDTAAYARDCEFLFGHLLHHFPYFGMRGRDDQRALDEAFRDSVALFIEHYGIDPTAGDAAARGCRPQRCP